VRHDDTVDKIVSVYLGGLCRRPFRYKGRSFVPRRVRVSPQLLRGYTCYAGCGGCCGSFSLDYLPAEDAPANVTARTVELDGRAVTLRSDMQTAAADRWCGNLDRDTGRCTIYARRPFACDFELIRLLSYDDHVVVTQKQYGRFWAMLRLDGERGVPCDMLPPDPATIAEVERKLTRLETWAEHFGVATCVPAILDWVRHGDHACAADLAV
jgi:hypothetical protein